MDIECNDTIDAKHRFRLKDYKIKADELLSGFNRTGFIKDITLQPGITDVNNTGGVSKVSF